MDRQTAIDVYAAALADLARMQVECGADYDAPPDPTPADIARALLASSDPPRGKDAETCQHIIDGWVHRRRD